MKFLPGLLFILLLSCCLHAQPFHLSLNKGWSFKATDSTIWRSATVPGTVHTDLMRHRIIPDPFYRDHEAKVQWVSAPDWEYRQSFEIKKAQLRQSHIRLVFEGLDTYADIFLNGKKIAQADNMFRTWKYEVKQHLKPGANQLLIRFHSATRICDSLAALQPAPLPSENNRNQLRKAQYNFGWDWGPKLVTCGIWRKVYLEGYDRLPVEATRSAISNKQVTLVQDADSAGRSFYFRINGKPVFMKGANWIPADVFLPRVTKDRYRQLLLAAREANLNMLRVWGGGIYEDDAFYDLCDSLGIMVWQDFMFAGAMYPFYDTAFLDNVRQEVIDNIQRLRRHSCIVLWCGNNEIDEAWHNWGWQTQFSLDSNAIRNQWQAYVRFFRDELPQLVQQYDGNRPYVSTSPRNGWGRKESMTDGDSHYWGVWWGQEPIARYKEKIPRFMSEYGMQAMPDWATIEQFSAASDRDTSSAVMRIHQKHPTGYQTLAAYLKQEGYHPATFREFAAATQDLQSKALRVAIEAHMNAAPYCMGTLFWQFNDCWPVSSWSVIDYYGRRKKAFYTVKSLYSKEIPANRLPVR